MFLQNRKVTTGYSPNPCKVLCSPIHIDGLSHTLTQALNYFSDKGVISNDEIKSGIYSSGSRRIPAAMGLAAATANMGLAAASSAMVGLGSAASSAMGRSRTRAVGTWRTGRSRGAGVWSGWPRRSGVWTGWSRRSAARSKEQPK